MPPLQKAVRVRPLRFPYRHSRKNSVRDREKQVRCTEVQWADLRAQVLEDNGEEARPALGEVHMHDGLEAFAQLRAHHLRRAHYALQQVVAHCCLVRLGDRARPPCMHGR